MAAPASNDSRPILIAIPCPVGGELKGEPSSVEIAFKTEEIRNAYFNLATQSHGNQFLVSQMQGAEGNTVVRIALRFDERKKTLTDILEVLYKDFGKEFVDKTKREYTYYRGG